MEKAEKEINEEKNVNKPEENLKEEKQNEEKDKNNEKNKLKEEYYIPDYIKKYGKEIGLPNLKMNENGVVSLNFRDSINVDIVFNEKNDQCFFASPVGYIPKTEREKFYEELLISNNSYNENGGVILGLEDDNDSTRVVLSYTFIASTFSYQKFKNVLTNFVDIAEAKILKYEVF